MLARAWHGTIALLVVAALVVQLDIAVRTAGSPPAHAVGTLAGAGLGGRLIRVLSFFTIQTNILAAVVSAQLARDPRRDGRRWRVARLDALVAITVTGVVYTTVLAQVHQPSGWKQVSTNAAFHYVVPMMMVLGWVAFGPRRRVNPSVLRFALIWPALWFAYTLVHGAVSRWYPYPFVDVATHGYGRVMLNALLVVLVFGVVAALVGFGDRALGRAPR